MVVGFIGFGVGSLWARSGRGVHWVSPGIIRLRIGIAGFIGIRLSGVRKDRRAFIPVCKRSFERSL